MELGMENVHVVAHPLVQHHLGILRNCSTSPSEFRQTARRLAMLLASAATEDLTLAETTVTTPLTVTSAKVISQRIGIVPILRAGLGLVEPLLDLIPQAEVWHLGLFRDEETALPVEYYQKLPATNPVDVAIVLDPMLATGGSVTAALSALTRWGVKHLKVVSLISAPEGLAAITREFPDVGIYVSSVDQCLNDRKFIVPGLGDAGDRLFNTLAR